MDHLVDRHALIGNSRIAHGVMGDGAPVALIHGTPSSSYIWRNVAPRLVEVGWRVHVYDLLGFGLSERPWDPDVDTSVTGQVPVLAGMMDAWGLESAHIVAHDIGGAVAKRFAIEAPERVRSLTLIDIVSFDSWPSPRTRQQMAAGLDKMIGAPDAAHRAHFRDWLLSAVSDKDRMAGDALDVYLDFISGPVGQASLFQHQISRYDPRHTMEVADRLGELSALPVQILWGAEDAWQVPDWARKLAAAIPGAALHMIDDCGHFAMEDQPEAVSALVAEFLRRSA